MTDLEPVSPAWVYPLEYGDTLSNHDWVPLYINRLLTSDFVAYAVAEGRRGDIGTALLLWAECFKQDPAGSLPDDDVLLAQIARYGAELGGWRAVRRGVLHGWIPTLVEGSGVKERARLGHPVIAEIAVEMHRRKSGRDQARVASRLSSLRSRVKAKLIALHYPKGQWDSPQVVDMAARYLDENRLYATDDNVRMAMQEAVGILRPVTEIRRARGRGEDPG